MSALEIKFISKRSKKIAQKFPQTRKDTPSAAQEKNCSTYFPQRFEEERKKLVKKKTTINDNVT